MEGRQGPESCPQGYRVPLPPALPLPAPQDRPGPCSLVGRDLFLGLFLSLASSRPGAIPPSSAVRFQPLLPRSLAVMSTQASSFLAGMVAQPPCRPHDLCVALHAPSPSP